MRFITQPEAWAVLTIFGLAMFVLVWRRRQGGAESFLVADRQVPLWGASLSIAVSWIWAPAIFLCSMQAYTKGLPGILWFTAPNVLCFFLFAPLALRLRRLMPHGYTLPEFIARRYPGRKGTHLAFLGVFLGYQLGAIVINCVAGGALLHSLSGMDPRAAIVAISVVAMAYSLVSGLRASIFTDVVQMAMILVIALLLVPWCLDRAGGWAVLTRGLGGVDGQYRDMLDPWVAYTLGIPMTLGLLAGPLGDQMFFQRSQAVRPRDTAKTFILGGLIFAVVPITLSLLGFLAAGLGLTPSDPQMVGAAVVAHLLPKGALLLFCFMAFAGLASTLDSAYCALSALGSVDIYRRYVTPQAPDAGMLRAARITMVTMSLGGTALALLLPKLLWVFLIYGALASAAMFPTILSLTWRRLNARAAFWAVVLSLMVGTPLSILANIREDPHLIVIAALASVAIGLAVALVGTLLSRQRPFDFSSLGEP